MAPAFLNSSLSIERERGRGRGRGRDRERQTERQTERESPCCRLNNHPASNFLKVTNMAARKQVLHQKDCISLVLIQTMYKCRKCIDKHHISICNFLKNRRFSKNRIPK